MDTPAVPHESPHPLVKSRYKAGDVLADRYRLLHRNAAGGMGVVWTGRHLTLDLPVAVKLLHHNIVDLDVGPEYFSDCLWREARAAASVNHPAIVKAYDFGLTKWNDAFMAMELLEGEPLSALIVREGRIAPERALQIMLPIADGLDAVHAIGIVHRDLKPDNIFLAQESRQRLQPKIVDFGIAKMSWLRGAAPIRADAILGTPGYMSPEQVTAADETDQRADIWSFCMVLYETFSGALPFADKMFPELLRAIAFEEVPSLVTTMSLDPDLWAIVERGLRKNPEERWPTMRELGNVLAGWLAAQGVTEDATGAALSARWDVAHPDPAASFPTSDPDRAAVDRIPVAYDSPPTTAAFLLQPAAAVKSRPKPRPVASMARWALASGVVAGLVIVPTRVPADVARILSRALPSVTSAWAQARASSDVLSGLSQRLDPVVGSVASDASSGAFEARPPATAPRRTSAGPAASVASDFGPARQLLANP